MVFIYTTYFQRNLDKFSPSADLALTAWNLKSNFPDSESFDAFSAIIMLS